LNELDPDRPEAVADQAFAEIGLVLAANKNRTSHIYELPIRASPSPSPTAEPEQEYRTVS
jgi:hypothetical protein